jgi:hypothetical protein
MKCAIAVVILVCAVAHAEAQRTNLSQAHAAGATHPRAPYSYQTGKLIEMTAMRCSQADDADPAAQLFADIPNTKASASSSPEWCPEYKLRSEKAIYLIRPLATKHSLLLPVGEIAQFRIKDDHVLLKIDALDGRERAYKVLRVTAVKGPEVAQEVTVW